MFHAKWSLFSDPITYNYILSGISLKCHMLVCMHAGAVGWSDRKELKLKNLMKALNLFTNWETLGVMLDVAVSKMNEISINRSGNKDKVCLCKQDLLYYWLKTDPEPSWDKVAVALDDMDETKLASEIRATYCSLPGNENLVGCI